MAVFSFRNLSRRPEAEWLSTALAEMFRTELAAAGQLRLLAGENVARTAVELSLGEPDTLAPDTLQRIRANLGTDLVVFGSYLTLGTPGGGKIRLDLRVQDAASGETVASFREEGVETDLFELVGRAGEQLRGRLGLTGATAAQREAVQAALPSDPEAVRLYAEGLARLRRFDALGGRDLLEQAAAREPGQPVIHAALAEAWAALGYDARAQAAARKAVDLSGSLDREQRLQIEARYEETCRRWPKAVELYRTLWTFYPGQPGLRAAAGLRPGLRRPGAGRAGHGGPAPEAGRAARPDPRIDLVEAAAAGSLADYPLQLQAAGRAVARGTGTGARLLVARGRLLEAAALQETGRLQPAREAASAARDIFAATGDRAGQAQALKLLGIIHFNLGDRKRARQMFEESLRISREIGNLGGVATSLGNLAILLRSEGDAAGAMKKYQESLAILREIDDKPGIATSPEQHGQHRQRPGGFRRRPADVRAGPGPLPRDRLPERRSAHPEQPRHRLFRPGRPGFGRPHVRGVARHPPGHRGQARDVHGPGKPGRRGNGPRPVVRRQGPLPAGPGAGPGNLQQEPGGAIAVRPGRDLPGRGRLRRRPPQPGRGAVHPHRPSARRSTSPIPASPWPASPWRRARPARPRSRPGWRPEPSASRTRPAAHRRRSPWRRGRAWPRTSRPAPRPAWPKGAPSKRKIPTGTAAPASPSPKPRPRPPPAGPPPPAASSRPFWPTPGNPVSS